MKRVVITGQGVLSPIGNNIDDYYKNLINGVSGVDYITKFDASSMKVKIAGEVKDFKPEDVLTRREIRRSDIVTQYAMVTADEAIKGSGLDLENEDSDRMGVIVATGIGGANTWEQQHQVLLNESGDRISPFFVPMMIINSVSAYVSIKFGLKGPNFSIVSACASSGHAIADAYNQIILDNADVMICGGSEAAITKLCFSGFIALQALSTKNDVPQKASRPFDADRDGFIMAEGAGMLVLESYEHAKKRGANILAEIIGYGYNGDAYHITAPVETGDGAAKCMELAVKRSKRKMEDVQYINAHGTSTKLNDQMETKAIKTAFNDHADNLLVSSTKSMTGHLLGATSAIEAIATILAIKNGIVPPTINQEKKDPECDLNYVPNEAIKKDIDFALSNSFGFGGHNVCLAFSKFNG